MKRAICVVFWAVVAAITTGLVRPSPQPDLPSDDDPDESPPGLIATYRAAYRAAASDRPGVRIDSDIEFDWGDASPDPRVPAEPFRAEWRGKLTVPTSGSYTFHIHVSGAASLKLDGREIITGTSGDAATPRWLSSESVQFEAGELPIEVRFEKVKRDSPRARIGLYWESRGFGIEPVPPRLLSHDRAKAGDGAIEPGRFDRGQELVRAYRCAACHELPGVDADPPAPSLERLVGHVRPEWLVEWLQSPHDAKSDARMPAFGLTPDDARAVAAFLLGVRANNPSLSAPLPASGTRGAAKKGDAATPDTDASDRAEIGAELFRAIGCLACHRVGDIGTSNLFGGGSLDRIGDKRPIDAIRTWLKKPEELNPNHRMPVFALSNQEVDDLAAYLATLRRADAAVPARDDDAERNQFTPEAAAREKQLISEFRCAACHAIAGIEKPKLVAVHRSSASKPSCLGSADLARRRPGYEFGDAARAEVTAFLQAMPASPAAPSQFEIGRRLLRERNCTACHARDLEPGLQPAILSRVGDARTATEFAKLRGELEPPNLSAVGDKFNDATLATLIDGGQPPRRSWLKVRMPKFKHADAERAAIVTYLVAHDRIPDEGSRQLAVGSSKNQREKVNGTSPLLPIANSLLPSVAIAAGHELVSARGFGCMSCHTIGKHQPKGIVASARGSDLLAIGERVRHEWFLRWVRNPARIVPGMEMPAISQPVAGIAGGKFDSEPPARRLELELESLWVALNSKSFVVPSDRDTAQQILSLKAGDPPAVLRDVMFDCPPGSGWCPRSFAIGLPNRHNILFDLDTMSLRAWWVGDFARQRIEGKTWLWEPAGLAVWNRASALPPFALRNIKTGRLLMPIKQGQTVARLRFWAAGKSFEGLGAGAALLSYEVQFASEISLTVYDDIAEDLAHSAGFRREISFSDVPNEFVPVFLLAAADDATHDGNEIGQVGPLGRTTVRALTHDKPALRWQRLDELDSRESKQLCFGLQPPPAPADRLGHYFVDLRYDGPIGNMPPALIAAPPPEVRARTAARLDIAPGFEAIRLPLDSSVMPTAIAFLHDGMPIVCSLKGRLYIAKDSDGDGIEANWIPHGAHLAAPFGLLVDDLGVYVCHKPELLELSWLDGKLSTFPDVIATGWGLTEDYHDWTFGIVRDAEAKFIIGTGSDYTHKDRPREARKWRGKILRVSFDGEIEELARGARYPTGFAKNRDGAIFFTDNQGVQNTFNEINHLVPGSRYGVPALDDPLPEKDAWPERAPAICIPHPWTRSVNGICFLESLDDVGNDAIRAKWGPFAGHGIGCDYDTGNLIRFTMQRVGDTYQGACYPFTTPADALPQNQRLLGPICCAVSPNGDLYVGGMRDSGWGGGNNIGELVRVRPTGELPLGIRELRAWRDGFVIEFTGPVDEKAAGDSKRYTLSSYHRIWQGNYATPDSDRRTEQIRSVAVSADGRRVTLTLDSMRPGFVYEIHVAPIGPGGKSLWPADAFYTLNQIPDEPSE